MKLRHTLIAASLLAFAAPAFAAGDDADIYSNWDMYNSIYVMGDVFVSGEIDVSSESAALVDQDQATVANWSVGDGDNFASASGDALSGALGNIGANIAAGVGNAQANDAALASVDGEAVFASAMLFNNQTTGANLGTDAFGADAGLFYDASVSDNVLASAAGNIGLNVAAGVGNAQTNALAASVNSSGNLASASADSDQLTLLNGVLAGFDLDNDASLSGMALSSAVGNIGVNIAAGVGNAQHNGLSIAVASCGTCD
ncbi:hypothetical protein N799_02425 [Lysobacter arseniciresistens ZS79]|uniref:Cell surface protein n=1 Tax=Lysobacter arseniciresistens ZS79 TaxID=913325 RepID=A0A0A0F1U3_9GAMM|nr:hypothetical protein [Lysobacter arseniciresistens]KGM56764.1 hypothetical protein N799_02425 [Lysobacter arseniciresistens ZS79]